METPEQPRRDQIDPAPEDEVPGGASASAASNADAETEIDPDGDPANHRATPHSDVPAEGPADDAA